MMKTKPQVREVGGVMVLPGNVRTTFKMAQDIAEEHSGRLLTLKDALRVLANPDSALSRELTGHWIWLEDKLDLKASGRHGIDYENGTLVPASDSEYEGLHFNQKARVWKGSGLLALFIGNTNDTKRMILDATGWPSEVARPVFVPLTQSEIEAASLRKAPETAPVSKQLARDAETSASSNETTARLEHEIRGLDDVTEVRIRPGSNPGESYFAVYIRWSNEKTIARVGVILEGTAAHKIIVIPDMRD